MFITEVKNKIIKNSRKERTIQVTIHTYEGTFTCSAPSGKSKGSHEVHAYNKKGIDKSLVLLNAFSKHIVNKNFIIKEFDDLLQLDTIIKAFENRYAHLGANVTYALHGAFLKAAAKAQHKELFEFIHNSIHKGKPYHIPMPIANVVGGGVHTQPLNNKKPDFQEFHLIPKEKTMKRAFTRAYNAYLEIKTVLKAGTKNDENAWRTSLNNEQVLETLYKIAHKYNLHIGLDIAANSFYKNNYYHYTNKALVRDRLDQIDYLTRLIHKYHIHYCEDPLQEEDFSGFKTINENTPESTLIVGDDLTVTNTKLLSRAIRTNAINAIIIKPNQIGSLIEVKKVVELCHKHNITMIFSHRSGETMDNILADYCIGFGGHFIKTGIDGKERLIKIKRVMDIEKMIQAKRNS